MRTTTLWEVEQRPRKVAVGEFDGVHLGHREVIRGSDTVLTFEPHPLRVVRPEAAPKLLTSLEAKSELIAKLGVDELVVIPFDDGFAHQTPQEFIDHVLVERLRATHVSVGENFRFGHRAAGDTDMLGSDSRFQTRVVPLVEVDGEVVSPGHVVYAARADGDCAAVSVGVRPTFGTGRAVLVEAFLLDREVDLYGQILRVDFLARLRGERRFESVETLVAQMSMDVERAREL